MSSLEPVISQRPRINQVLVLFDGPGRRVGAFSESRHLEQGPVFFSVKDRRDRVYTLVASNGEEIRVPIDGEELKYLYDAQAWALSAVGMLEVIEDYASL